MISFKLFRSVNAVGDKNVFSKMLRPKIDSFDDGETLPGYQLGLNRTDSRHRYLSLFNALGIVKLSFIT